MGEREILPRVVLINMPFAATQRPSLGLTQLQSALREELPDAVSVEVLHPNLDFAHRTGVGNYDDIAQGRYWGLSRSGTGSGAKGG